LFERDLRSGVVESGVGEEVSRDAMMVFVFLPAGASRILLSFPVAPGLVLSNLEVILSLEWLIKPDIYLD
jgi:hypothetical protein